MDVNSLLQKIWPDWKLKELIGASQGPVINVYTQPGMNETAVANAVALKLDKWLGERV